MTDLAQAIVPKSDQLNADDLIAGPITITISRVSVAKGEQPITINFEGDNGKPYKPCKSMARVLVLMWGADGKSYAGRRLQLYRDPDVRFGPDKVGGIRISHMSDIDDQKTMPLTTTRGRRAPYTVKPLKGIPSGGKSAGADVRADGAKGESLSPPADDDFPGDRKSTFEFKLIDSKGAVRSTLDGEQWASSLEGMFRKAADDAEAEALWRRVRGYVSEAEESGHLHFAQRVWVAAQARGVEVE